MKAAFSQRFSRRYKALSPERKAKFDKQLGLLLSNLRHPSLRAKKYDEARDVWQARVDELRPAHTTEASPSIGKHARSLIKVRNSQ